MSINTEYSSDLSALPRKYGHEEVLINISEVFSGIQGEGPWVGLRQVFCRTLGCDLRCTWCDTPDSLVFNSRSIAKLEEAPGDRRFVEHTPSMGVKWLAGRLVALNDQVGHHSISLTGGEPLLQVKSLRGLIDSLRCDYDCKLPIYLETGGHRPNEMAEIADAIDIVSFDIKLPGSCCQRPLWDEHAQFVNIVKNKPAYAKVVVTASTEPKELEMACNLLLTAELIQLVIQPVHVDRSRASNSFATPPPEMLLKFQDLAIGSLGASRVRVIPQTHKIIGQH